MSDPIYIAGPTASGKSEIALILAERIGGEIISADSMQVYRGMEIGTAKPTAAERARVPHHLLDVAELQEPFSVAHFIDLARQNEKAILSRGHVPIYCGGTGLYFKALIHGVSQGPPSDPLLKRDLELKSLSDLLEELAGKDPETFARIDRSNPRRVIRALEVIRLTGKKFSAQQADWNTPRPAGFWFGLQRERSDLVRRIETRVDEMFARGLIEETRKLLESGLGSNPVALQSLGYRQVVEYLSGERSLPETVALIKQKTRQFAKRQMTWFRHQLQLEWIPVNEGPSKAAEEILRRLQDPHSVK